MRKPFAKFPQLSLGLAAAITLAPVTLSAQEAAATAEAVERQLDMARAQELMVEGDRAYNEGDFAAARAAFKGSVEAIPANSGHDSVRGALMERFASATIEQSRGLVKKGDVALARAIVEEALAEQYAWKHVGLTAQLQQVTDPIRTNVALTPEHAANVDEVRRLLYTAQSAFDLADFDKARDLYHAVLRIDKYNTAARRGLEAVHNQVSDYSRAAYDEARADMLAQVDAAWESRTGIDETNLAILNDNSDAALTTSTDPGVIALQLQLEEVRFDEVTLDEALQILRSLSQEAGEESGLAPNGINFSILANDRTFPPDISVNLRNVPLSAVLDILADASGTTWQSDGYVIVFSSAGAEDSTLRDRTWTVPSDMLTKGALAGGGVDSGDPFATPAEDGVANKKLSAKEFLEARGVSFPEGSEAGFSSGTNRLFVRNTRQNLELVNFIVQELQNAEPVNIVFKATIVTINQENLEELGFDWLLGTAGRDNVFLGGGSVGNGAENGTFPAGAPRPVTAGNRSGEFAFSSDGIDNLLSQETTGFVAAANRAPGILQLQSLGRQEFSVLMRGFNQKKGTDVAATPSVVTIPNSAALVESVREFIYPTEYEPPELPNSSGLFSGGDDDGVPIGFIGGSAPVTPVTPATPTAFDTRRVGTTLSVEGTLSDDRRFISLTINGGISTFDGFVNYGSPITGGSTTENFVFDPTNPFNFGFVTTGVSGVLTDNRILMPVFSQTAIQTAVTIESGATVAIGGLSQARIETVNDQVPILGNLPLVGRFFRTNGQRSIKDQVIIFITAEVQDAGGRSVAR